MINASEEMSVASRAARIFSGSVEPARLMASQSTRKPTKARALVPSMSTGAPRAACVRLRNRSFTRETIGFFAPRPSAHTSRERIPSASLPSAGTNSLATWPASIARMACGRKSSSFIVFVERMASLVYEVCSSTSGAADLSRWISLLRLVDFAS